MSEETDLAVPPARGTEPERDPIEVPGFVEAVAGAVATSDVGALRELVADLHESDLARLLEALPGEDRPRLVELLGPDFDFTALTELDETARLQILEALSTRTVVEGLRELESDDAVYILEDLDEADKQQILAYLPTPERAALQRSLDYPEASAGRRMQTEFIALPPFWTVGQTLDYIGETEGLPETFFEVFVVDPTYRHSGSVPLDRLIRTRRNVKLGEVVTPDRHVVQATDDQEDVARVFERYNLISAPVVDEGGRLVGVLTVDDIVDVIQEEADEDLKALGGVAGDEELSDSFWYIARSRFSWLLLNLIAANIASFVISLFEGELQKMVALAVLMPIVASQGGNAGTQTMTVAVRALATRELRASNARRIVMRELLVGLFNGVVFAVIMAAVVFARFGLADLGYVIGLAMIINLVAAALGGILIPLGLDRLKVDPAVSSGPFVTTVTDVVGFFAFLGIASLWF
ncbi:magnesium transporter [Ancylobacter mangrovi]|uniref:Magnesium transporter MgtE n=1 Tax=Ancylobacter mangrovi TaxID=2972472 RepID=A0A9X2PI93_9HYPH|nr:magnesium transporter [Ancylobacter mangrovi]MCS0496683.1 magnesium transporter [Ancylobacter mangrovi]MCS0505235.1 magnesium transporter [Ancylobacter mangrovi]